MSFKTEFDQYRAAVAQGYKEIDIARRGEMNGPLAKVCFWLLAETGGLVQYALDKTKPGQKIESLKSRVGPEFKAYRDYIREAKKELSQDDNLPYLSTRIMSFFDRHIIANVIPPIEYFFVPPDKRSPK